jgi:hypothetical protein
MAKTQHEKMKDQIVSIVERNGLPLRSVHIRKRVTLPDDSDIDQLLNELIAQGRLTRSYTLLANGDTDFIYH